MANERVKIAGLVDPDVNRLISAAKKYDTMYYQDVKRALDETQAEIVSVCVRPEQQHAVMQQLAHHRNLKGVWCEKPWKAAVKPSVPVQVNYIRRFEPTHQAIRAEIQKGTYGTIRDFVVVAKDDEATRCHFVDFCKWIGFPVGRMTYVGATCDGRTVTEYTLYADHAVIRFREGGATVQVDPFGASSQFPGATVPELTKPVAWRPGFMQNALNNLLDCVEGKAELMSPAE
jgi:hypothetical protein